MHADTLLLDALVVLAAAVAVVFVSARLRIPPIVGLVAAGMLVGPSGLALVPDPEEVEQLAEIGVVLLLFIIGLELSIGQLKALGRTFFLGGLVQAGGTTVAAAGIALWWAASAREAVFVGMVVALSSTAVVLKLYDQRRETATPAGRAVLGVLLFQDFLIVPMIVLTPVIAGTADASPQALLLRFAGAIIAIAAVAATAGLVMPRLLHQVAKLRVRELSVLVGLLVCLAMAWFTGHLGFSLALGAFLAGILVSETEYSHQMIADIVPFRDVFASLFFMSVGMLVDLSAALDRLPLLLALTTGIVLMKTLLAAGAIRVAGYPMRVAVVGGLGLAQIGEFSFVLMDVGRANGLLAGNAFQVILAASVLTLLATPVLVACAPAAGEWIASRLGSKTEVQEENKDLKDHVIIVGFGTNGTLLARVLEAARLKFVAIELNAQTVRLARSQGAPMFYGDATRPEILHHAGVERARVMVVAISDPQAVQRMVRLAKSLNPKLVIIVRVRQVQEIETLRRAGANAVVAEEFESAIEIFTLVLQRFHVPRNLIRAQTRLLRGEGYRMLRSDHLSTDTSEAVLDALEAGTTDLYRISYESPAIGKTLRDLDLRRSSGASVIAVVRGERSMVSPPADLALEAGDCLVLVGGHAEIDAAFVFLDRAGEGSNESGQAQAPGTSGGPL